jgi:ferrous-iron efflux pump FieF
MTDSGRAAHLRTRATYASVAAAAVLIVAKFAVWLGSDSVALLSSLVDSLLDAVTAVINLLAVRHALDPPDREHRFGHGKAEPLAALGQAAFLGGSAAWLMVEAGRRLLHPVPVQNAPAAIAVMIFAIPLTVALVLYQRSVVRRTGSLAIGADEFHYRSDIVVNVSVIAAIVSSTMFGLPMLDPLFGAAIGLWIIYGAGRLAVRSMTHLMDQELPDEERANIRAIAQRHPDVAAVHDLRTRAAGPTAFIQLHLEMDGAMTLLQAHRISDEVEAELRNAYPNAEIMIHEDPEGVEEPRQSFPAKAGTG